MTEETFQDAEGFNPDYTKDKITFRDIILQHLRKITAFSSCEFIGGYWQERTLVTAGSTTQTIKTYVPDSREVYSNAVECMADMLYSYFDKEMKDQEEECNKQIQEAFMNNTIENENNNKRKFQSNSFRISFRDEKRAINKKLFRYLCSFLYRKKYLELGSIED